MSFSSPASSPAPSTFVDSSPPLSPRSSPDPDTHDSTRIGTGDATEDDACTLSHPFAGSTHASNLKPPLSALGEKRRARDHSPETPRAKLAKRARRDLTFVVSPTIDSPRRMDDVEESEVALELGGVAGHTSAAPSTALAPPFTLQDRATFRKTRVESEKDIWEDAINRAVDKGTLSIDLMDRNLTYIPSNITDLANVVVLTSPTSTPRAQDYTSPSRSTAFLDARSPVPGGRSPLFGVRSPASITRSPHAHLSPSTPAPRALARTTTAPALAFSGAQSGALGSFLSPPASERMPSTLVSTIASPGSARRMLGRSETLSAIPFSATQPQTTVDQNNIQLFLAQNSIRELPGALFTLNNLTVLTLRRNALTYLPPQIVQLTTLCELNVSSNKLRYLPAELQNMTLQKLIVHPNCFEPQPPETDPSKAAHNIIHTESGRATTTDQCNLDDAQLSISETKTVRAHPPSLVELALRVLLQPSSLTLSAPSPSSSPLSSSHPSHLARQTTLLEEMYQLPREGNGLSPLTCSIIDRCVPSLHLSASMPSTNPKSTALTPSPHPSTLPTGISICPSPRHDSGQHRPVYFWHAEQRLSWTSIVAGCAVGGVVPLLWRGCSLGCTSFLDRREIHDDVVEVVGPEDAEEGWEPGPSGPVSVLPKAEFTSEGFEFDS